MRVECAARHVGSDRSQCEATCAEEDASELEPRWELEGTQLVRPLAAAGDGVVLAALRQTPQWLEEHLNRLEAELELKRWARLRLVDAAAFAAVRALADALVELGENARSLVALVRRLMNVSRALDSRQAPDTFEERLSQLGAEVGHFLASVEASAFVSHATSASPAPTAPTSPTAFSFSDGRQRTETRLARLLVDGALASVDTNAPLDLDARSLASVEDQLRSISLGISSTLSLQPAPSTPLKKFQAGVAESRNRTSSLLRQLAGLRALLSRTLAEHAGLPAHFRALHTGDPLFSSPLTVANDSKERPIRKAHLLSILRFSTLISYSFCAIYASGSNCILLESVGNKWSL